MAAVRELVLKNVTHGDNSVRSSTRMLAQRMCTLWPDASKK